MSGGLLGQLGSLAGLHLEEKTGLQVALALRRLGIESLRGSILAGGAIVAVAVAVVVVSFVVVVAIVATLVTVPGVLIVVAGAVIGFGIVVVLGSGAEGTKGR